MKNSREIISNDPQAKKGKDQKSNSCQPVILFRNGMGHIMNNDQEQQHACKNDQQQEQTIFCRMVGFRFYQIKKRFAFVVSDRKRCRRWK